MAREDWTYISFEKAALTYVDYAVAHVKQYGKLKYKSRKDFISAAIDDKLLADKIKQEATAS